MKRFVALVLLLSPALSQDAAAADAQFRAQYEQQYRRVEALRPDMLVEELRLRIELVASRGNAVGGASNERRVRGFESALLPRLKDSLCTGGKARATPAAGPAAQVVASVIGAAEKQGLRTVGADVAEISAMTQRLLDSLGDEFCALSTLDDVR
jgi:hypothetical protein